MGDIIFDQKELMKFLTAFDVTRHKYAYWMTDADVKREPDCQKLLMDIGENVQKRQHLISGKQLYSNMDIYQSIEKIYHEKELEHSDAIKLVTKKFLYEYVDIHGLERLFDARYFEYEWSMHLEYQAEKHEYSNYRDHYLHQIRNMFEMFQFLDRLGFEELCRSIYGAPQNVYGIYLKDMMKQQEAALPLEDSIYDRILSMKNAASQNLVKTRDELVEEMLFHEIIYSATIIAALAHDIGYPILHISRTGERLKDFLPLSYKFYRINNDFISLRDDLSGALLLEVIDFNELTQKLKSDHGAISAVILLLFFYKNGYIFSLPPVKRAAIELAAVMIYKHTIKYDYQERKKREEAKNAKGKWYQNVFREDPLSYLFRLCDDIQEWERIYFQISEEQSFFLCPKCKTPITYDGAIILENEYKEKEVINEAEKDIPCQHKDSYSCLCRMDAGFNKTAFGYSRLLRVKIADKVSIQKMHGNTVENSAGLLIQIHYDLFKLLQLSAYNPKFLAKRSEEMRKIKRALYNQMLMPKIYLDAFVSANPLLIKLQILDRFLRKAFLEQYNVRDIDIERILEDECDIEERIEKVVDITRNTHIIPDSSSINNDKRLKNLFKFNKNCSEYLLCRLQFYEMLLSVAKLFHKLWIGSFYASSTTKPEDDLIRGIKYICKHQILAPYDFQTDLMVNLLLDCLKQYMKSIPIKQVAGNFNEINHYEAYENMYMESDFMVDQIKQYTSNRLYKKLKQEMWKDKRTSILDFHSDLYAFMVMDQYKQY